MSGTDLKTPLGRARWILSTDERGTQAELEAFDALIAALAVAERERDTLREKLARAAFIAGHLMAMIDQETWRATGGDDQQGHYEGDYRAAQTLEEINEWAALASVSPEGEA
jgi:hypothetical protein